VRHLVELQRAGQAQAGQLGAGEQALLVFLARIVEDVEHVDGLAFRQLRRDLECRRVHFARQQHGVDERVHGTADSAFDLQRTLDVRQQVRLHCELLGSRVQRRGWRVGHRGDGDHLRDPPVAGVEGQRARRLAVSRRCAA
jgi:hypothetical protein